MTVREPSSWGGFLVPDPRAVLTASAEDGAHVGPPVPSADNVGDLVLRSLRVDRAAAVDDVVVTVTRGGAPVSSGRPAEVSVAVGAGSPMGWMEPVVAWGEDHALTSGASAPSRVARVGGHDGWTSVLYSDDIDGLVDDFHDLAPAGDGELLAVVVQDAGAAYVIHSSIHDATGAALRAGRQVVDVDELQPAASGVRGVRAAWFRGSALLLVNARDPAGATRDRIYQWSSDDGGLSWSFVGSTLETDADAPSSVADVVTTSGAIVVVWATQESLENQLRASTLASPTQALWTAAWVSIDASEDVWNSSDSERVQDLDAALVATEEDVVHLLALTRTGAEGVMLGSVDHGGTWREAENGSRAARWAAPDSAATRLTDTDAVSVAGAVLWHGREGVYRHRLQLGGWTSRGATPTRLTDAGPDRGQRGTWNTFGWTDTWQPWGHVPGGSWSFSGTASVTFSGTALSFGGPGASRVAGRYVATLPTSNAAVQTLTVRAVAASADLGVDQEAPVIFGARFSDGVSDAYAVRVAIGSDRIRVYKQGLVGSWGLVASEPHTFGTAAVEWYARIGVAMTTGDVDVSVVGRLASGITLTGRDDWTDFVDVTFAGIDLSLTTGEMEWGGYLALGEHSTWTAISWCRPEGSSVQGYPDEVPGRPLAPRPVLLAPDVMVAAAGGAAATDDAWTIATAYDHAAANAGDPNPGLVWRPGGRAEGTLTAAWGDDQPAGLVGILLRGLTAEAITVELYDVATAAWVPLTTSGYSRGLSPLWAAVAGGVLRPAAGSGARPQLREAELDGAWLRLDGKVGQITQTRAGVWDSATTAAKGALVTSRWPSQPAAGSASVLPRDMLIVCHTGDVKYSAARVTLAAASSAWPDGVVWTIQRMIVGAVRAFGDAYGWGRAIRVDVAVDEGRTSDDRVRPTALGPPRRTIEVSWTDGVDVTRAGDDYEPDGVAVQEGGAPVSNAGATPFTLQGIFEEVQGAAGELVYIPGVARDVLDSPLSSVVLHRRHQFLHGRLTSSYSADSAQGDPEVDEVLRVASFTIREER